MLKVATRAAASERKCRASSHLQLLGGNGLAKIAWNTRARKTRKVSELQVVRGVDRRALGVFEEGGGAHNDRALRTSCKKTRAKRELAPQEHWGDGLRRRAQTAHLLGVGEGRVLRHGASRELRVANGGCHCS